jgi:hypothetical protein
MAEHARHPGSSSLVTWYFQFGFAVTLRPFLMKKETLRGASQSRSDVSSPELEEDVEEEVDLGLAVEVVAGSAAPSSGVAVSNVTSPSAVAGAGECAGLGSTDVAEEAASGTSRSGASARSVLAGEAELGPEKDILRMGPLGECLMS